MSERATAGNMRNMRDTLSAALQETMDMSDRERIRTHPGKGTTVLDYGLHRLEERSYKLGLPPSTFPAIEQKAKEQFEKGQALCESPIERSMLAALITGPWGGFETLPPIVHNGADKGEMLPQGDIVIVPQMAFVRYRFDFGVVIDVDGVRRPVCVECDGANYHTDYVKEVGRTNYLNSWGIPVFKFTGSELHEDAIAAADEVIASICKWRFQ